MSAEHDCRRSVGACVLRARGSARRRFCAGLAILGLYVQLFAAGLCTAGFAPAAGAFPICHTPATGSQPDQAPAQDHRPCPFCALHCKAAMVLPPSIGAPERFTAAAVRSEHAAFLVPAPARFSISAPPRGPPASA
ncbi:MAG: hypothetical protein WBC64_00195 [Methylovirgula sp.]